MGSANRLRLSAVREITPGTTPNTPRMRLVRTTGESLDSSPQFEDSQELRDDRMQGDPTQVGQNSGGPINGELAFPPDLSPESDDWMSVFQSAWINQPSRDNDGTADSVITGIVASTGVITVLTGAAFVASQLVQLTGMGVAQNNVVAKLSTGSATVPAVGAGILADEAVPPATARMQVVGLQGAAGDLVAVVDGITSTTLNWTLFGIVKGQWVKVGGTGAGNRFATEGCNGWARVSADPVAGKLTLDNLPTGWAADAGTGKTIKIFYGDYIRNGVTPLARTFEKGFMDQGVPTYLVQRGAQINNRTINIAARQRITMSTEFLGMSGGQSTTSLDAVPDARNTHPIMAGSASMSRVAEGDARLSTPNWANSLGIRFSNNLRTLDAVDEYAPVDIQPGDFIATIDLNTYFGSNALLTKKYNGTPTALAAIVNKLNGSNNQGLIFSFPRVIPRGGADPAAGGKNQDVMAPLQLQASIDSRFNCMAQLDRIPYFEA